jgi:hypothetical protein
MRKKRSPLPQIEGSLMEAEREYTPDEIAFHSEAIRDAPWPLDEHILIDPLYLGAVAANLVNHHCAEASRWTAVNQDALLLARERNDRTFPEVIEYIAGDMLRTSWLDRFFHGVSPNDPDPKTKYLENIGALEELAMSAILDVRFVVQAFRDTPSKQRHALLDRLAETSRRERRSARQEE